MEQAEGDFLLDGDFPLVVSDPETKVRIVADPVDGDEAEVVAAVHGRIGVKRLLDRVGGASIKGVIAPQGWEVEPVFVSRASRIGSGRQGAKAYFDEGGESCCMGREMGQAGAVGPSCWGGSGWW